ncbi:MAG: polysaccharide biosynthesis protein [Thermanaerothrix sp.]|nr:polysaccharide biosynthesis protein [Thermanaerothrix sp.]
MTNRELYLKMALDISAGALVSVLALVLRLGYPVPGEFLYSIPHYLALSGAGKLVAELLWNLHRQSWKDVSIPNLKDIFNASAANLLITSSGLFMMSTLAKVPRSVPVIDSILYGVMLCALRILRRRFWEKRLSCGKLMGVIIAGAGEAGISLAREMLKNPAMGMELKGFLDDDPQKRLTTFLGYPVLGGLEDLKEAAKKSGASEVLIAMPSAEGRVVKRVLEAASSAGLKARIVPSYSEIVSGKASISQLRDVNIEDLLRREPVRLDLSSIRGYVDHRVVMVTGAGGSIGSEITRQLARFSPGLMVLVGRGENSLFHLKRHLSRIEGCPPFKLVVADVRDRERISQVMDLYKPEVVFHAAAHKHVPFMEENPEEAIKNNFLGTKNVARLALEKGVRVFVNISTDKAVNPTSVMGASKRLAEMEVLRCAEAAGQDRCFVSVRFGNVLGSRGSVIPIFKDQIRRGGPVTVTHPDMSRYFMTIPEAAQLVIQAGGLGENGKVFVLDMGEPVRIADLARDLILLSGLQPGKDITIEYTGVRPGEKLYEELFTPEEGTMASRHSKILIAPNHRVPEDFEALSEALVSAALKGDPAAVRDMLARIIPGCRLEGTSGHE